MFGSNMAPKDGVSKKKKNSSLKTECKIMFCLLRL